MALEIVPRKFCSHGFAEHYGRSPKVGNLIASILESNV